MYDKRSENPAAVKSQPRVFELIDDINRAVSNYSELTSRLDNGVYRIGNLPEAKESGSLKTSDKVQESINVTERLESILRYLHTTNERLETSIYKLEQFV